MEFNEVLTGRRSCRNYLEEPVPQGVLDRLITAATWAPSPLHLQPWRFVVVKDAGVKAKLKAACQAAQQKVLQDDGPAWVAKYSFDFMDAAPVWLVVLYDPAKGGVGGFFNQPHGALQAASAAVQNLMLAAWQEGLGSLWLTFFDPAGVLQALEAPPELGVAGLIPLGYPAAEIKTPPRKDPLVYHDTYSK